MKTLGFLLKDFVALTDQQSSICINHVTNDSRLVTKNTLFLAYPGEKSDGRDYIQQTIEKGAAVVCYEGAAYRPSFSKKVIAIPIVNLKIIQSTIAARFYDFPSKKIPVVGVTGTNGKTSITHFIAQSLEQLNVLCGIVGTIGYGFLSQLIKTPNTTPDGVLLQKIFAELIDRGAQAIAMEVSSHALVQQRVRDVQFHTAVFTNLTQDHLDFHHTMENYRDAKALLFQQPALKNIVINIDDAAGEYYVNQVAGRALAIITYSIHNPRADVYVEKYIPTALGFQLTIRSPWGKGDLHLPLIGEFNIYNALAVLGVLGLLMIDTQLCTVENVLNAVSHLHTVPGRMELLHVNHLPSVLIDYAHTPDALEKALLSARMHCRGKLICVFGCGGNRDKTKRPKMGSIAARLSDHVIITNDNPRHELPELIAQEILAGITNRHTCEIELDRAAAIRKAIQIGSEQDWILIAGKGHETEQIIGDHVLQHSDKTCVMALFDGNL